MAPPSSWILIGGTGQEFGLTASTLALIGVVPTPDRVILIDADAKGPLYEDFAKTLDLVRYRRYTTNAPKDALLRIVPLEPKAHAVEHNLAQEFSGDKLLSALYANSRIKLDTSAGFKAEPQIGSASFFRPAFNLKGDFRQTLNHIQDTKGHIVSIVASVAGGTGSGLWQLVCRLVKKLYPEATIRLLLIGPLMSLQQTGERDADEKPLTNRHLDSNAAAGFRVALEAAALAPDQRPFSDLYLLGYPIDQPKPEAPSDRTGRRDSRMTLVAATMLGHAPTPVQSNEHPGVFVCSDDLRPGSMMTGITFLAQTASDESLKVPVNDIGFILAQTLGHLRQMRGTAFGRAFSPIHLFGRRQVGRTILKTVEDSRFSHQGWKSELDGILRDTIALLERFKHWVSNRVDQYPGQVDQAPKKLVSVAPVKAWQLAVDRLPIDPVKPENRAFHLRRWICSIGPAHIHRGGDVAGQPGAALQWLLPVKILKDPTEPGWSRVPARNIHPLYADRPESFPTPFARAYWNLQNLRLKDPTAEQRIAVHASKQETQAIWLGLVGSVFSIERMIVTPLDITKGVEPSETDAIDVKRVCAFVEDGQFAKDRAGHTSIQFLKLRIPIEDKDNPQSRWAEGSIVGAIHPLSGPFLGPNDSRLASLVEQRLKGNRATLEGLLAYWIRSSIANYDNDGAPPWLRSIFSNEELNAIPEVDPDHVQATLEAIELLSASSNTVVQFALPVVGAAPKVLRFKNKTPAGIETYTYPVLPAYTRDQGERDFLSIERSAQHAFAAPRVDVDTLVYEILPGKSSAVRLKAEFEDLKDWNIEVFPGERAPKEWSQFGIAIEPAGGLADHSKYDISIYVETEQGQLKPIARPEKDWSAHAWVQGRPRLLCVTRKAIVDPMDPGKTSPAVVGFFPLLGPAHERSRQHTGTSIIALDVGTSRSFMAVKAENHLTGGPFSYPCKQIVTADDKQNTRLGAYCHWHPLRRVGEAAGVRLGELARLDYQNDTLRHARVMLLPSNLVRRTQPTDGGARNPFSGYSISAGSGLPDETKFRRLVNLKWEGEQDALSDYITLLLLTGIAELDAQLPHAPSGIELRFSFPLAFDYERRGRLREAIERATHRADEITGIRVAVDKIRYLDESMAGMYHVGLNNNSWKLSLDIGGGTADIALMHNVKRVVADSVRLGGDLVIARHARKTYLGDSPQVAMSRLGQKLRGSERFSAVFGHQAPELSAQLLALAEDYVARVVAGAFVQIEGGKRPPEMTPEEFQGLKAGLGGTAKVPVSLYLFGGAWRLAELSYQFEWSEAEDAKIQKSIGKTVEDRVNTLLEGEGCTTRVQVSIHHTHLHQLGGEKAAVALGLLNTHPTRLRPNITGEVGIFTVNGLDETFEDEPRHWFEWVGAGVAWRKKPDTVEGRAVSQPLARPGFTNVALREWEMSQVIGKSMELQMSLTPTKESPYYCENNQQRTRGAMAVAIETCFVKKFSQ